MAMIPDLIFHGVGVSQLVFKDGSFLNIDKSQDLSIAVTASEGKVQGGDSLYDLMTFVTEKTGKVTITNAVFNMEGVKASTGTDISTSAEVWVQSDKKTPAAGSATLSQTSNVIVESVVARRVSDGTPLKRVTGTPATGEFKVTTAGAVTTFSSDTGEIEFSYRYTAATGQAVHMLENDIPKQCELRHSLISEPTKEDGKAYKIDLTVYNCKATGSYTYDAKRGAAFAPKMEFNILDAGRADKRVISYNITEYVA